MDNQLIVDITRQWVRDIVVGLNLCPFAAPIVKNNSLRIIVCDLDDLEGAHAHSRGGDENGESDVDSAAHGHTL